MRLSITSLLFLPLTVLASTSPTTSNPTATNAPPSVPDKQFVPEAHILRPRQGVGAAGGVVGAAPSVTQMSPTTTYMVRGPNGDKTPMPYTQLFSKVPEQWPSPTAGTVGLGTIQGVIGVVKTQSKRSVGATVPTDIAQVAEKVRVLKEIVKRKAKGKGGDANGVGRIGVGRTTILGVGVVAGALVGL